jgi:hypothetical protein
MDTGRHRAPGVAIFPAVLVAAMRETGAQRSLVPRAAVPRQARVSFARALPCLIALWALGGSTCPSAGRGDRGDRTTTSDLDRVAVLYRVPS